MDTALDRTIKHVGSRSAIARALGIVPQAVQQWEYIPPKHALKIEELTDGTVTAREILEEARDVKAL